MTSVAFMLAGIVVGIMVCTLIFRKPFRQLDAYEKELGRAYELHALEAVGYMSAAVATRVDAWKGNGPEGFPEPPEWVDLWADAVRMTAHDRGARRLTFPETRHIDSEIR